MFLATNTFVFQRCFLLSFKSVLPATVYGHGVHDPRSISRAHQMRLDFEWHCPTNPTFTRIETQHLNKGMEIKEFK
jgi:hypothetical protein